MVDLPHKSLFITQSNYIPWKGYFDAINWADEFMLYDEMQFTKNDWRNRNLIKTVNGLLWLTIPVEHKSLHQKIRDTKVVGNQWRKKHWESIRQSYGKAPHFSAYKDQIESLYLEGSEEYLSEINAAFLRALAAILGIKTDFLSSADYELHSDRIQRLVELCVARQADRYLTGPAARAYLDDSPFRERGIEVHYFDYSNYPEYPQQFGPFEHSVSLLDLLFNTGPAAREYMKSDTYPPATTWKQ